MLISECLSCHVNESPSLESLSVIRGAKKLSHHRNTLRGGVKSRFHVGPLNAGQRRAQQSQSGAFFLGPVREESVSGGLPMPKQVQLFGLIAQSCAQVPPPPAASVLQEALHLFLSVWGKVDVQAIVLLAVSLGACKK